MEYKTLGFKVITENSYGK